MTLENAETRFDDGRETGDDPADAPSTAASTASAAGSDQPVAGGLDAAPARTQAAALPDGAPADQQGAGDTTAHPPHPAALRRPRFRDRPRDWWLLTLLGKDVRGIAARGSGSSRLQYGVSATQELAHRATDQPGTVAVADATESVDGSHESARAGAETVERALPGQPARPSMAASAIGRAAPALGARQVRGLIAAAAAIFLLGIVVSRFLSPGQQAVTPPATAPAAPTSPGGPYAPASAAPVVPLALMGSAAHLVSPHEAVVLPNGHIAVADTGNSRVLILDAGGHVLQAVRRGAAPFQQPFAVAALGQQIVVLDAARGSVDVLSDTGRFMRELMHSTQLVDARGLAVGPNGEIYVANPRSNSVLVLSTAGKVAQTFGGPLSAGPGGFNQPSDVAVAADGTLYVLDNQNNRIEALSPAGHFIKQWPTASSDTVFSVHVLPLARGGVLASDPAGALLVYSAGGGQPVRHAIAEPARQPATVTQPQGLSLLSDGRLLVTDAHGRLLVMRLPSG